MRSCSCKANLSCASSLLFLSHLYLSKSHLLISLCSPSILLHLLLEARRCSPCSCHCSKLIVASPISTYCTPSIWPICVGRQLLINHYIIITQCLLLVHLSIYLASRSLTASICILNLSRSLLFLRHSSLVAMLHQVLVYSFLYVCDTCIAYQMGLCIFVS